MKLNKSIAVIAAVACLSTASVNADDVRTVIKINQSDANPVNISKSSVNPKITIQDYINAANEAAKETSNVKTNPVNISKPSVNPKITIQDYINAANEARKEAANVKTNAVTNAKAS